MDLSTCPEPGMGGGTSCAPPYDLVKKEAKKFFEFFKIGTKRKVVLLDQLVRQRVHWIDDERGKVQCTQALGKCLRCQEVGIKPGIGESHYQWIAASGVVYDRKVHQRVAVFTEDMVKGREGKIPVKGLRDLFPDFSDGPERGHAFEVHRESKHHFKFIIIKRAPVILPPSFDLLPWCRAAEGRTQEANRPLRPPFEPFAWHEGATPLVSNTKELDVTLTDIRSAEEWHKTEAALKEAKKRREQWEKENQPNPTQQPSATANDVELAEVDLDSMTVEDRVKHYLQLRQDNHQQAADAMIVRYPELRDAVDKAAGQLAGGPLKKDAGPADAPDTKEAPKNLPQPRVSMTKAAMRRFERAAAEQKQKNQEAGEDHAANGTAVVGEVFSRLNQRVSSNGHASTNGDGQKGGRK